MQLHFLGIKRKQIDLVQQDFDSEIVVTEEILFDNVVDVIDQIPSEYEDHLYSKEITEEMTGSTTGEEKNRKLKENEAAETTLPKPNTSKVSKVLKKDLNDMHVEVVSLLKSIDSHIAGMDVSLKSTAKSLEIIARSVEK